MATYHVRQRADKFWEYLNPIKLIGGWLLLRGSKNSTITEVRNRYFQADDLVIEDKKDTNGNT